MTLTHSNSRLRAAVLLLLGGALLALVTACGGEDPVPAGSTARVGQIPAADLRIGECIEGPIEGNPDRGRAALCADAVALYRVSEVFQVADGVYPGADALQAEAEATCSATFLVLYPTEERWATGDRTVVCFEAK